MQKLTFFIVVSLFVCGCVGSVAGFMGFIYPAISFVLILPCIFLLLLMRQMVTRVASGSFSRFEYVLLFALIGIWLMHFTGVFVPETGFDAVWYHLPIVSQFVAQHRIFYIPDLYQSVNPLFSDLIFLLGFQVGGDLGAKIIAFLFGIGLVLVSYALSREFLSRRWALISVIIISTFQVVTWQSSSFYVDVAKAFWEVAAVWMLVRKEKNIFWSGLLFGASLATKLFSFLLWPAFIAGIFLMEKEKKWQKILTFSVASLIVALPFYLFTFFSTGTPFYSIGVHTDKLSEIGGNASLIFYLMQRSISLPFSLFQLTLFSRDYISILFLIFLPLFFAAKKLFKKDTRFLFLLVFSFCQWLIWWFVPPLSTRYAVSGFVVLMILFMYAAEKFIQKKPAFLRAILITIAISVFLNLAPRSIVFFRNTKYLFGMQTKEQYIKQFYDGNIDQHLQKWYGLKH